MTKLSIRTGDRVRVLAGKDKGKEAKVLAVYPDEAARGCGARESR